MRKHSIPALTLLAVLAVVSGASEPASGRKILHYVDPMNPAHTSDKPGLAPCGMKMEPVYADEAGALNGDARLPGSVKVSTEKQQLIGVRMGVVEKKSLQRTIRLLGRVSADDTRVRRLLATVTGWVIHAPPFSTGSPVKKDQILASYYSSEFLSAAQALLAALNTRDRAQASPANPSTAGNSGPPPLQVSLQQYLDPIRSLGMGESQIEEMVRTRKIVQNVDLLSPVNGFVAERNLFTGMRFQKGTELFRIVDLSRVWILVDAFEQDAAHFTAGSKVRVSAPNAGAATVATVSDALPQFDPVTRTLKVRLVDADNPGFAFKPDLFVDVELVAALPETLVVPADAILDAGLRKTVFLDRGNGCFEPRPVTIGERGDNQVQVLQGLTAGERIVVSGNFLLDSESRMKLAAAGVYGTVATDPVCGMTVDEPKARAANCMAEHLGKVYFFCNDGCKADFVGSPEKFLKPAASPSPAPEAPAHRDQPHH